MFGRKLEEEYMMLPPQDGDDVTEDVSHLVEVASCTLLLASAQTFIMREDCQM